jgi:DNA-binding winged helix-turn-helix (wHTH) protein/TolB-like protein
MVKVTYKFGPFSIDPASRLLLRDTDRVALPPKAVDVLLALVKREGQLVAKDELLNEVWPDTFVEEGNLARHIFLLRKTLGENKEGASYVETVPKRGYRFIGHVQQVSPDLVTFEERTTERIVIEESETGDRTGTWLQTTLGIFRRRLGVVTLTVALTTAVAVTVAAYLVHENRGAGPDAIRSLAVLPLKPLSTDAQDKLLEIGIADTVISKLSRIGGLTVRPTSAIRKYVAPDIQTLVAARELQVQLVLEGTLQRAENKLRVTVNLLRAKDGASLWSETFDTTTTDLFGIQDEIARQLANRLHEWTSGADMRRLHERDTSNVEALQAFQAALQDFDRRTFTSTGDAIPLFQRAIQLDGRYARAHALLAYCYAWHALFIDVANAGAWVAKAEESANVADRLNPGLPETHVARSELLFSEHGGWRIDEAIRELKTAIVLDPQVGHLELGILFAHLGAKEPGKRHLERALAIDPVGTAPKSRYVEYLQSMGEYEEALSAYRRFYNRDGPVEALLRLGRTTTAKPLIERALVTSSAPRTVADRALLLALKGGSRRLSSLSRGSQRAGSIAGTTTLRFPLRACSGFRARLRKQ